LALRWYRMAAERGYAPSQSSLGRMLLAGADATEGLAWLEKGLAQKEPLAQREVGLLHLEGKGVARDETRAAQLLRAAAEQGDGEAQYRLALLYGAGRGVPKDESAGLEWMKKAADRRHPDAEYFLAAAAERRRDSAGA